MIEWVPLGSGARPVPRPVAAPLVWAGAFGGALLLVGLLNGTVGSGRPGLALVALSLLAALLGLCAPFAAAPGTAVLCWLSLNGFAIPPAGPLTGLLRQPVDHPEPVQQRALHEITGPRGRERGGRCRHGRGRGGRGRRVPRHGRRCPRRARPVRHRRRPGGSPGIPSDILGTRLHDHRPYGRPPTATQPRGRDPCDRRQAQGCRG